MLESMECSTMLMPMLSMGKVLFAWRGPMGRILDWVDSKNIT